MTEHENQRALFGWAIDNQTRLPELKTMFAIPNAGKRSAGATQYYYEEGLKPGMPDICLPIIRKVEGKQKSCLFIEMKYDDGKVTANQEKRHEILRSHGSVVVIAWSTAQAIQIIEDYLMNKLSPLSFLQTKPQKTPMEYALRKMLKGKIKRPGESKFEVARPYHIAPEIDVNLNMVIQCSDFYIAEVDKMEEKQFYIFGKSGEKRIQLTSVIYSKPTAREVLKVIEGLSERERSMNQ
jgi:hypothetical protein